MTTDKAAEKSQTPRRRIVRVSMATRLAASVVVVSFVALMVATIVGLATGERLGKQIYEDQLGSLGAAGASDVAAQLGSTSRMANSLASSPQAAIAIDQFATGLDELSTATITEEQNGELIKQYQKEFLVPLQEIGRNIQIRSVASDEPAPRYLQYNYAVNLGVVNEPAFIDDIGDESLWSETHAIVHPVYREVVEELDLLDLYLVDAAQSRVVYSVNKRPDLATSLILGPSSGSVLANTVNRVINNPDDGTVISDLAFYDPFPGTPVGVVASPVISDGRLLGVIALMYDGLAFTDILTPNGQLQDDGSTEFADTYLVGDNSTTRSDPRGFVESPQLYLDESETSGNLSASQRTTIEAIGTTVLTQPIVDATFTAGEEGDKQIATRSSLTGRDVFSLVTPVPIEGVTWYVVAEINTGAAESGLDDFKNILIVGASIFVVIIAFFAVGWANNIMRPVRAISERLGSRGQELGPLEVSDRSPIELQNLAHSFESMSETLARQQVSLALAREGRLRVMRNMLPQAVAERIASGVIQSVDKVPSASVVVLVVLGMGDLVRTGTDDEDRDLVDRMTAELDDLAERHGLDRIKVVGDAYFAACGHDRPYIDHAPRVVAFAEDAHDALVEFSEQTPANLDIAVGIDTGSVTVGMTGGARLLYDVWGEPVTIAHSLARRAGRAQVFVSDATRELLPDEIRTTPVTIPGSAASAWSVVPSTVEDAV